MPRQRAFTLTDILITIFIIAALIAIVLPILSHVQHNAQISRKKADLNAVSVALESFKAKFGDYPRMNRQTVRRMLPGQSEAEITAIYDNLLDSQLRGARLLTMALVDSGLLTSGSFQTVQVYDSAAGHNVELLASHDGLPILYYPALPVRLDLSQPASYVAAVGPQDMANRRAPGQWWQPPLFNAWDNAQLLPEQVMQVELRAGVDGSADNTVPPYLGAYLLWVGGESQNLLLAYQADDAIIRAGGGQPLIMVPGGRVGGRGNTDYVGYAAYAADHVIGDPLAAYVPPDLTASGADPWQVVIPAATTQGIPAGWVAHEIPPRTPNQPPADAIKITDKGAKANDGGDDWQAIKNALDQARREGKAIVIPDGEFNISRPLNLQSGDRIYGPGILKLAGGNDFAMHIPGGTDGIVIDGLAFDGGGVTVDGRANNITFINSVVANVAHGGANNNGAAFRANAGLTNSRIEQNHFINVRQEGVWINTTASGTSVSYNYFQDVWQAVHVISNGPAKDIKFNYNYGVGLIRMGIEFQGNGAVGSQVIGNTFKDWKESAVYDGSFGLSIYNFGSGTQIIDNMLQGFTKNPLGIEMAGTNGLAKGNVVIGFREGMHVINADNSVVTGNSFSGQSWMSIWFPGYGSAANVQIVQNSFDLNGAETAILFMGGGWGGTRIEGNTAKLGGNTQFIKSHSGTNGLIIGSNQIN
ncbi:MAG: hypothetical protein IT448_01955 [Phycisphaerales bacterium]|nr:hypothetical protein [Phycisphaerales bacterium]